jgi:hypothetical protein
VCSPLCDTILDRQPKINTEVVRILEDPATMHHLAARLIIKKPRLMRKALLWFVLAPAAKKTPASQC